MQRHDDIIISTRSLFRKLFSFYTLIISIIIITIIIIIIIIIVCTIRSGSQFFLKIINAVLSPSYCMRIYNVNHSYYKLSYIQIQNLILALLVNYEILLGSGGRMRLYNNMILMIDQRLIYSHWWLDFLLLQAIVAYH